MDFLLNYFKKVKEKFPETILLIFHNGFYFTFEADAETVSAALHEKPYIEIIDSSSIYTYQFSINILDEILPLLVKAGNRVALTEEIKNPSKTFEL